MYAVEASNLAHVIRKVVDKNQLSHVIEVSRIVYFEMLRKNEAFNRFSFKINTIQQNCCSFLKMNGIDNDRTKSFRICVIMLKK